MCECRVLLGSQNPEVVGKCIECHVSYDEFGGRKVCTVCRDIVLVCDACFSARHGELHCTDHQYLKDCYFTFIQYLPREELEQHRTRLEQLHAEIGTGKEFKHKRKTLRKQIDKLTARLATMAADGITITAGSERPIHCRTCGLASCAGNCWGFWNEFPGTDRHRPIEQEEQAQ